MAASASPSTAAVLPGSGPVAVRLSAPLEQGLTLLVVVAAIKTPLGLPLYLNAGLLVVGLFGLAAVQALHRVFLWPVALLALAAVSALASGALAGGAPRLGQLALLLFASSVVARLDPDRLARYLALLLPVMVAVFLGEALLFEPQYDVRRDYGLTVHRHGGIMGEPNYNAVLYGFVGLVLAEHGRRWLAPLPILLAVANFSRSLLLALTAWWLAARPLRRSLALAGPALALGFCLQPLLLLAVDAAIEPGTREALIRVSSHRYALWLAYVRMGFEFPFGAGYFQGPAFVAEFEPYLGIPGLAQQAHSIYLQAFSEFGWVGYLLFTGFLVHLAAQVSRWTPRHLPLLLFLLTAYAFVNGLSDWAFWVGIGYLLARVRLATAAARTGAAAVAP